jgi:hypothetical protein
MAAESNANRRVRERLMSNLHGEITELIVNVMSQHNFLIKTLVPTIENVMIPRYSKHIRSTPNGSEKEKYKREIRSVIEFVYRIGDSYTRLYKELRELENKEKIDNSNKNEIRGILAIKQDEFDKLNISLNRFFKDIRRSLPDINIPRVTSSHTRLNHTINKNFKFKNRNRSPTRRGRSKNRSNSTPRVRNRSRSAIRNPNRPYRGSIRIHETSTGPITFHRNNIRNRLALDPSDPEPDPSKKKIIIQNGMVYLPGTLSKMQEMARKETLEEYGSFAALKSETRRDVEVAIAGDASAEAAAAATSARQAATSSISPIAQAAANDADSAARNATRAYHAATISHTEADARRAAQQATTARNAAISARGRAIAAAASSSASAASSRRNST